MTHVDKLGNRIKKNDLLIHTSKKMLRISRVVRTSELGVQIRSADQQLRILQHPDRAVVATNVPNIKADSE